MSEERTRTAAALIPVGLFIISIVVYVRSLAPNWGAMSEFNTWDGLEYTLCASLLGIDHPPGHPTYLLLAKATSLWPGSSPARMINLISAASGAFTVLFLYAGALHVMRLGRRPPPLWWCRAAAGAISLGFGFSYVFWSHCEIPEVHTLFLALLAGALASVFRWQRERRGLWLNCGGLLAGAAVGVNMLAMIAALPPLLFFVWRERRAAGGRAGRVLPALILFLSGFLAYLYYPLRIDSAPFSHPMNMMAAAAPGTAAWYGWYLTGAAWTAGTMFFLSRVAFNMSLYARFLMRNLGLPMLALSLIGLIAFIVRAISRSVALSGDRVRTGLFLLLLLAFIAVPELSIHDPSNPQATDYLANFFLPSLMVLFYWLAAGLAEVHGFLFRGPGRGKKALAQAAAACLFAFPAWQFLRNASACDLSRSDLAYRAARRSVAAVPGGSLILSKLVYPQIVEYFTALEPLPAPVRLDIVNPDVLAASLARRPATAGCRALFARRNRALIEEIERARRAGRPVFMAGDAVEMEKAPERTLIADLLLGRRPAVALPAGAPREIALYEVEGLRRAEIAAPPPPVASRGIANDGVFAGGLRLRGCVRVPRLRRGRGGLLLQLDLLWEATRPLTGDIYVVVTVLDGKLRSVPGAAAWYTLGGRLPPARWRPGEAVEETVTCMLPALRPGGYWLALGLTDCDDRRLKYLPARPAEGGGFDYVLFAPLEVSPALYEEAAFPPARRRDGEGCPGG